MFVFNINMLLNSVFGVSFGFESETAMWSFTSFGRREDEFDVSKVQVAEKSDNEIFTPRATSPLISIRRHIRVSTVKTRPLSR